MNYEYEVKEGDTLSEILYNKTGDGSAEFYNQVAKDNGIKDPNLIVPGQTIKFTNDSTNNTVENASIRQETVQRQVNQHAANVQTDAAENDRFSGESTESLRAETNARQQAAKVEAGVQATTIDEKEESTSTNFENQVASSTKENINTSVSSANVQNVNNTVSERTYTYTPDMYEICVPGSVNGFEPLNSFRTFQIKENAGEEFVSVNNLVKACCQDINGIIASLNTLKNKMGENTGTTSQIQDITNNLELKKQDLITKNSELIAACNQVVEYVYENKSSKSEEASVVAQTIANINIYKE